MKLVLWLLISSVMALWSITGMAFQLPGPVVETDWLASNKDKVVILGVRKDTKSFTKQPVYAKDKKSGNTKLAKVAGHIPGSVLVNYKKLRKTVKIDGKEVQKMIVGKADFEKIMQDAGVNQDSAVVIVSKGLGDGDITMATRLYWQMKYYGHDNMAILNGGLAQWIMDKREISSEPSNPSRGNWSARAERDQILATSADVQDAIKAGDTQLVDTRSIGLYLGTWRKKSYVYANGHIPGAKSYPNELLTTDMPAKVIDKKRSISLLEQMRIKPNGKAITYCNSGHLASGSWFLMSEVLGNKNVKLYDGSMHQWTLESRPVVELKME